MPIRLAESSQLAVEKIEAALSQLAGMATADAVPLPPLASVGLSAPHRVFTIGLQTLLDRGLEGATPLSLRYLVLSGNEPVASAEVFLDPTGQPTELAHLNQSRYVQETAKTLASIEARSEFQSNSFELRLLRIPGIHVIALWLKDEAGQRDILFPLEPGPAELRSPEPREAPDFIAVAQDLARRVLGLPRKDRSPTT